MMQLFVVSSYRDIVRLTGAFMLASVLFSLIVGNLIAYAIGQSMDWRHLLLNIGMPLLMTPAVVIPLATLNFRLNTLRHEMQQLARTDSLTGLRNRRAFFEVATSALAQSSRETTVMMIDVDRFKEFNDRHGHDAGDAVLRMVAQTIASVAGTTGVAGEVYLARIGGEEFALLATGVGSDGAARLAEAICARVRASQCVHRGMELRATISVGVALGTKADMLEQLLKAADTAVYEAKRLGRDRWCLATPAITASGKGVSQVLRVRQRAA